MTFLHPALFAAAIGAVAIPIAIHLLMRRRRKPVLWGAMRFLVEAYRRQRRRLLIEQWLLLALRCLVVLFVGLAIARPLIGGLVGSAAGSRTLVLVIDNSIASASLDPQDNRPAIERHRQTALATIDAAINAGAADRVAVVTLASPAEGLVLPGSSNIEAVRRVIQSIEPTDARADVAGALALLNRQTTPTESDADNDTAATQSSATATSPLTGASIVFVSDWPTGVSRTDERLAALPPRARAILTRPAPQGAMSNIAITSIDPLRRVILGQSASPSAGADAAGANIRVVLERSGSAVARAQATTVRVGVARPDAPTDPRSPAATATATFAPGQRTTTVSAMPPDTTASQTATPASPSADHHSTVWARIDTDPETNANPADSARRQAIAFRPSLRVGVIAPTRFGPAGAGDGFQPADWLRLALRPDNAAPIDIINIEPASLDAVRLATLDAVLCPRPDLLDAARWRLIARFLDAGGFVLVSPPADQRVHTWTDAMTEGLALNLNFARETTEHPAPGRPIAQPAPAQSRADNQASTTPNDSTPSAITASRNDTPAITDELLALLRGELTDLLRPVHVQRILPITRQSAAVATAPTSPTPANTETDQRQPTSSTTTTAVAGLAPVLALDDGAVLLWAGRPTVSTTQTTTSTTAATYGTTPLPPRRGVLAYLAAAPDLEWTDLPARPLMVPLMQELVRQGVGVAGNPSTVIAGQPFSAPQGATELRRIDHTNTTAAATTTSTPPTDTATTSASRPNVIRVGPAPANRPLTPIRHAGVWRAIDEFGADRGLVIVSPDTTGSTLDHTDTDRLAAWFTGRSTGPSTAPTTAQTTDPTADGTIAWLEGAGPTNFAVNTIAQSASLALTPRRDDRTPSVWLFILGLTAALAEVVIARRSAAATIINRAPKSAAPVTGAVTGAAA